MLKQFFRPPPATQQGTGAGLQFLEVQLLGLAMFVVEVAAGALEAGRRPDRFKAAGTVAHTTVAGFVDETLDHEHRMAPACLPVARQAPQKLPQRARGQVRQPLALWQHEIAAVADRESKPPRALPGRPAYPCLAPLQVQRRRTEAPQRNPIAVKFRNISQGPTNHPGAAQVVLLLQKAVEPGTLGFLDQPHGHTLENIGFVGKVVSLHDALLTERAPTVQSFRV